MKKIVFVIGSRRKGSFNAQLANMAQDMLEGKAEVSILKWDDVPFMDQDIEFPTPEPVERVREELMSCDGIWFFTPEYNYSYPGGLKNLLDWVSRPLKPNDFSSGTAVAEKKATISGVGGKMKTAGVREKLKELLEFMKLSIMEESFGAAVNKEAWGDGVLVLSEEDKAALAHQAEAFLAFIDA